MTFVIRGKVTESMRRCRRGRERQRERERERRCQDVKMIYADVRTRTDDEKMICADVKM